MASEYEGWGIDVADAVVRRFRAGSFLFWEGDESGLVYWLDEGCIAVRRADPEGRETIVRFVVPRRLLGHRALLAGTPHRASAQALIDSRVRVVDLTKNPDALADPRLLRRLADQLAGDLGDAEDLHHARTWHSVTRRALDLFERLTTTLGRLEPDGSHALDLPMSRGDLAAAIGASAEGFDVALRELVAAGSIELAGDRLRVWGAPRRRHD